MYYTIQSVRPIYSNELYHHGIKGQKWGLRRYQNPDGTLTAEGKKRYSSSMGKYIALSNDAKRTGKIYSKAVKNERKINDALYRNHEKMRKKYGIDQGPTASDEVKRLDKAMSGKDRAKHEKLTAKSIDAGNTEAFWRVRNKNAMTAVENARNALSQNKNRKIKDYPPKRLKNGQKILSDDFLSYSGIPLGVMLQGAMASGNPYAIAGTLAGGVVGGSVLAGTDAARSAAYKRRVEKEAGYDGKYYYNKQKKLRKDGAYR